MLIVSGSANRALAEDVAAYLGVKVANIETGIYGKSDSDGEIYLKYHENVSGKDIVLINTQNTNLLTLETLF